MLRSLYFDCFTSINGPYEDALFHFKPAAEREWHINPLSLHPSRSRLWVYEPVHKLVFIVFFQSYNYVEAVKTLPTNFSPEEISPIIRRINPRLCGQIRSIFIVLSDDLYRPRGDRSANARLRLNVLID